MKTYILAGTVWWTEYCSCSQCGGHEHSAKVNSFTVKCDSEETAIKTVISAKVTEHAHGNHSNEHWETVSISEFREGKPLSQTGPLLKEIPVELVQKAKVVGVPNWWNAPVERKIPIRKEETSDHEDRV